MIVRVFPARVHPERLEEWTQLVKKLSVPLVKSGHGLVAYFPGNSIDPATGEYTMVTVWKDLESLKQWAGEKWREAIIPEQELPLIKEAWLHNYEVFGVDESVR